MLTRAVRFVRDAGKELLLIAVAGLTYGGVRELTEGDLRRAVDTGRALHDLEEKLGVAWEAAVQAVVLPHDLLVDLSNWVYIWGHWPVIGVCALCLFAFRRRHYRLFRNAVLISGAIGFLFFALLPTAPPRLADPVYVDTVTEWSSSYRTLQPPALTNQLAAMPSLHFGWNLLLGVTLFLATGSLVIRLFAVVMPAAMAFAVVATANHWILDVLVGAAVVLFALLLQAGAAPAWLRVRRYRLVPGTNRRSAPGPTASTSWPGTRPARS